MAISMFVVSYARQLKSSCRSADNTRDDRGVDELSVSRQTADRSSSGIHERIGHRRGSGVTMRVVANTEGHHAGTDPPAETLPGRPWLLTTLLASGLCVAYLIAVFINWGEGADRSLYANLGMIPIGLAATLLALSASKTQPDRRSQWAWRLLSAALACFWAGDALFFVYQNVLGSSPFPSLADTGYLAYYPLVLAGLLCFPSLPTSGLRRVVVYLGCFLVVLGGAVVILCLFLLPTLQSSRDDLFAYSLSVGYPVGDLLLLAGIAWVLLRKVSGHPWSLWLLSAGLIVGLVADVTYGYQSIQGTFQSGGFSDAGYMLSWALFAWAGYAQVARRQERAEGHRTTRADEH